MFKRSIFTLLILLFSADSLAGKDQSSAFYEKALTSFNQQDVEAAYIHLKNSLKENEDNLPAKILMGRVLLISGYLYESEDILLEALDAGADPSLIADPLGKVWLFTNQNQKIIDKKFNNLNKQASLDWQVIVATANLNLGNLEQARKQYQEALQVEESSRNLNALASLEIASDNHQLAREYLVRSGTISEDEPNTWRLLGDLELKLGNIEQAISAYTRGFELDATDPLIKRSLVTAYLQKQDTAAAKSLLEDVLAQTPNDPTATLLKAWLLAKDQKNTEAAKELEALSSKLASLTEQALRGDSSLIYISALSSFAQQNYHQAKTFFTQYLTLVPDNINAVALLAQTHIKLGEHKSALQVMQRHERELLENLDSTLLLGELYLQDNKAFKTLELINKLGSRYGDLPQIQLLEIKTLIARGKQTEALEWLNRSDVADSDISFIITKARLLMEMQRYEDADQLADNLLRTIPNNIDFLNLKAAVQIKLGNLQTANEYVEQALAINPDYFAGLFNKATVLGASGQHSQALEIMQKLSNTRPDSTDTAIMLARTQVNSRSPDKAIENLQRVLDKDIYNLAAMELLADIYARRGELDKAVRQLGEAIKSAPGIPKYQLQRIELYIQQKQLDRAKREMLKVANLISDNPKMLAELSRLQLRVGEQQLAGNYIAQATQLDPDNIELGIEYIGIHTSTGNFDQARIMLDKWLKIQPDNPVLLVLSGDLFLAGNQPQNAATEYASALDVAPNYNLPFAKLYQLTTRDIANSLFVEKAQALVERFPRNHFFHNLLADYYINQGLMDQALPHYEFILTVEGLPNRVFILNNVANIYISKDLDKAQSYIDKAMELDSNQGAVLDTLGWITALKGNFEVALNTLRKAYAMNSTDPATLYHLAYTLHKLGRDEEAKPLLNKALGSGTRFVEKQSATELMNKLSS